MTPDIALKLFASIAALSLVCFLIGVYVGSMLAQQAAKREARGLCDGGKA